MAENNNVGGEGEGEDETLLATTNPLLGQTMLLRPDNDYHDDTNPFAPGHPGPTFQAPAAERRDAALEEMFWRHVPQDLWDRVVMREGIPGLHSSEEITHTLEEALFDPHIYKYVDVTGDGLHRFFEALDTDANGVLNQDELHEAFQRTLNDFGVWEQDSPAFREYWDATWAEVLRVLAGIVHTPRFTDHHQQQQQQRHQHQHQQEQEQEPLRDVHFDPFGYEAFAGLLRRLKLELALRVWDRINDKPFSLAVQKSMVKIDIDSSKRRSSNASAPTSAATERARRLVSLMQLEEEEVVLKTYVWNPRNVQGMDVTRRHMRDFFLCHRDPQWAMRWIIADSSDRANLIRLSIKYRFHPLHVEDVLKLERQQPRFLKYGGHYFIILPLLRLVRELAREEPSEPTTTLGAEKKGKKRAAELGSIKMEKSRVAIFAAGPPHFDTIISIHGAWRRVRNRCCDHADVAGRKDVYDLASQKGTTLEMLAAEERHDTFLTPSVAPHPTPTLSAREASTENIILTALDEAETSEAPTSVLAMAASLLHEDYSSVRHGNSNWMLHCMVETTVKMVQPIVAAYDMRLRAYQKELDGPDAVRMRERLSKPIMDVKYDLIWLQKRVKSMKPLLRSIINEPRLQTDEVIFYFQGVDDDLDILHDDINTMLVLSQGLLDESKYMKDDTRNEALKMFAVMTATFCPLQFVTGYFGTNFWDIHSDHSSIPLMNHPNGPLFFWLICLVLASSFLAYVRFKRKWI